MSSPRRRRSVLAYGLYAVAGLLLALAASIIIKLTGSADSDWVVGVITAAPVFLLAAAALVGARQLLRDH